MSDTKDEFRLPMPPRLEPKHVNRRLLDRVRDYFYDPYNKTGDDFTKYLASVGNKDSVTKNKMFDRQHAVKMIQKQAAAANDAETENASEGEVWDAMIKVQRDHPELRPRQRRLEYKRQSQQQQAAE